MVGSEQADGWGSHAQGQVEGSGIRTHMKAAPLQDRSEVLDSQRTVRKEEPPVGHPLPKFDESCLFAASRGTGCHHVPIGPGGKKLADKSDPSVQWPLLERVARTDRDMDRPLWDPHRRSRH